MIIVLGVWKPSLKEYVETVNEDAYLNTAFLAGNATAARF